MKRPDVVHGLLLSTRAIDALAEHTAALYRWIEKQIEESEEADETSPFDVVPHLQPMMQTLHAVLRPVHRSVDGFFAIGDRMLEGKRLTRQEYYLCRYLGIIDVHPGPDEYTQYRKADPEVLKAFTESIREGVRKMHSVQ